MLRLDRRPVSAVESDEGEAEITSERRRRPLSAWRARHRQALLATAIMTPVMIYFIVFYAVSIGLDVWLSFTEWNGIVGSPAWVGLDQFKRYLEPPYPLIMFNTALFAAVILTCQTVFALAIALVLNKKFFGRSVHRAAWYIPTLTSAAVMAQIATLFVSPSGGTLNRILESVGLHPVIWTTDSTWMRVFVIGFSVWRGIGFPIILFLAGLQGIDPAMLEAAEVDGASKWRSLRHITIPLLRPMTAFIVITSMITNFQIFEAIYILTNGGGPANSTNVMLVQIYNDAFVNFDLGLAAAGSVVMAVVLMAFSVVTLRMTRSDS